VKNKVAQDYFDNYDCTKIVGKVDFCVLPSAHPIKGLLVQEQSLLWAEAKANIYTLLNSADRGGAMTQVWSNTAHYNMDLSGWNGAAWPITVILGRERGPIPETGPTWVFWLACSKFLMKQSP